MNKITWDNIKDRLEENMRYMNDENTDHDEYNLMLSENETMEWISTLEGKGKAFINYQQGIAVNIQCEEDNIDN